MELKLRNDWVAPGEIPVITNINGANHPIGRPLDLPQIVNAAELMDDRSVVVPSEIVVNLIHQGSKVVIGGSSKARQTWVLMDLAVSVANGANFWGMATNKGQVLYVDLEIMLPFLHRRLQAIAKIKRVPTLANLDVWPLRGRLVHLQGLMDTLLDRIREKAYSMIIIDPIYKILAGRDENKAGDIADVCNHLEHLAFTTGAAVVYVAHFSKGKQAGKDPMDRISGSGVYSRDADTIITMTSHKMPNCYTVNTVLRNFPEQSPFVVDWQYPLMVERPDLDPGNLSQSGGRLYGHPGTRGKDPSGATETMAAMLAVLGESSMTGGQWQKSVKEQLGISKATFYRHRTALVAAGKMVEGPDGKWKKALSG